MGSNRRESVRLDNSLKNGYTDLRRHDSSFILLTNRYTLRSGPFEPKFEDQQENKPTSVREVAKSTEKASRFVGETLDSSALLVRSNLA